MLPPPPASPKHLSHLPAAASTLPRIRHRPSSSATALFALPRRQQLHYAICSAPRRRKGTKSASRSRSADATGAPAASSSTSATLTAATSSSPPPLFPPGLSYAAMFAAGLDLSSSSSLVRSGPFHGRRRHHRRPRHLPGALRRRGRPRLRPFGPAARRRALQAGKREEVEGEKSLGLVRRALCSSGKGRGRRRRSSFFFHNR